MMRKLSVLPAVDADPGPGSPPQGERNMVEAPRLVLRDLALARSLPLLAPDDAVRKDRRLPHRCAEDGTPLSPVILTTWSDDLTLWRQHPLALDGWRCGAGAHFEFPAYLTDCEINWLMHRGAAAAERGDLERAEYCFRRIANSWHRHPMGHTNLAAVYLEKIKQTEKSAVSDDPIPGYRAQVILHLEKALAATDAAPAPKVHFLLGTNYLDAGRSEEGSALLERYLRIPDEPQRLRARARQLIDSSIRA